MWGKKKFKEIKMPEAPEEFNEEEKIEEESDESGKYWAEPVEAPPSRLNRSLGINKPAKVEAREEVRVVKELPLQPVRSYVEKDGTKVTFITVEEALTEVVNRE